MTSIKKQMPRIIIQCDFNTNQLKESWCRLILISPSLHYAINLLYTWHGLFCRCIDNHPGYLCISNSRLPSKNLIGIRQHRHRNYYPLYSKLSDCLWFFTWSLNSNGSFTSISLLTNTSEGSCGIETSWSLTSAWIRHLAFIDIKAEIAIPSESLFTCALETTGSVYTFCIGMTTIIFTFINILTSIWSHWNILLENCLYQHWCIIILNLLLNPGRQAHL